MITRNVWLEDSLALSACFNVRTKLSAEEGWYGALLRCFTLL